MKRLLLAWGEMDKQELAQRLARQSRQSRGNAADIVDDLVYRLWKESQDPKVPTKGDGRPVGPQAPGEKP